MEFGSWEQGEATAVPPGVSRGAVVEKLWKREATKNDWKESLKEQKWLSLMAREEEWRAGGSGAGRGACAEVTVCYFEPPRFLWGFFPSCLHILWRRAGEPLKAGRGGCVAGSLVPWLQLLCSDVASPSLLLPRTER